MAPGVVGVCVHVHAHVHAQFRKNGPGSLVDPLELKFSSLRCEVVSPRSQVMDMFCLALLFLLA